MATVLLVRHGRTTANTTGVLPTRRTYLSVWAPEPGGGTALSP